MEWINSWLRSLPDDNNLYGVTGTVALWVMVAVVLLYFVRMKASPLTALKGAVISAACYYFVGYAQYFAVWYRVGFDLLMYTNQTANWALGFTLIPIVVWLSAKAVNTSVGFAGDVATLTLLSYHAVGRSGCTFSGCCYGFPCDWGLYSERTRANQFPVCWVESLFTLAILILVAVRICRKGYAPDGKNLPYFLLAYGTCRFFSELTRQSTYEDWLFWRISDVHFHMLVMATMGGFLLWHVSRSRGGERAEAPLPQLAQSE